MPEIPDKCKFNVTADCIQLNTRTNGDSIRINNIDLDQDSASALAWLINHPGEIEVRFREAE